MRHCRCGGAIGEAVAERLRREGATVVGIDQREHAVGEVSLQADLTDEEQVRRSFARVHDEFGRIDVLYNNTGLNDPSDHSALDMSLETWQRVFAANLTTVFLCCKHAIAHMLGNDPPRGSVGPEELERRFVHYPMGRFGALEEPAGTVAYLASDDSGFVTGAAFPLDGGIASAFTVPHSPP